MRWIEPGTVLMGSPESEVGRSDDEGPQHSVTLTRGFWLAETPCTQALWTEVLADNPSHFRAPERPVERVAWDDVQRFLDELTRRLPGPRFELPSEAQWEYACRAGTASARYAEVDISAWCWHNSGGSTHPVGQKQPNSWGLYDMLGNVWEWCADGPRVFDSEPVTDPRGLSRERRACRGGSWGDDPRFARSACRMSYDLDYRYGSVGFRLILLE
jgi:formylglycine-generating enzyme required for sulfatase activity